MNALKAANRFSLGLLVALVASPLLAQQSNPPANQPAPVAQEQQQGASAASEKAEPAEVVGTLVTFTADRVDLKVEKAVGDSAEAAAGLVGQTVDFIVDAKTQKPTELKAGDRVDLWFTENNGERHAVRVALAEEASEPAKGAVEPQAPIAPPSGNTPPTAEAAPVTPQPPVAAAPANAPAESPAASAPAVTTTATVNAPVQAAPSKQAVSKAKRHLTATKQPVKALVPPTAQQSPIAVSPDAGATVNAVAPPAAPAESPVASPEPQGSVTADATAGQPQAAAPPANTAQTQRIEPIRFVELGGGITFVALVLLYLTLRPRFVEFSVGGGKGDVG